jgi:hypothetical protein
MVIYGTTHMTNFNKLTVTVVLCFWIRWFMVFKRHFQHYFSHIVTVSFIGGGNRIPWRKLFLG